MNDAVFDVLIQSTRSEAKGVLSF
ncbi:MAG: hypothetical protein RL477_1065, partial [Pseudomonadota bacterium]